MSAEHDSLSGLQREVASLWASYRHGPELSPEAGKPEEVVALRELEARQRVLLSRRSQLRAERALAQSTAARWGPAAGGVAALLGWVVASVLAVLLAPEVAAWTVDAQPELGLVAVGVSLGLLALCLKKP